VFQRETKRVIEQTQQYTFTHVSQWLWVREVCVFFVTLFNFAVTRVGVAAYTLFNAKLC